MLAFILLSIVMVVGAIATITVKNAVHASLSLVGTLLTLAMMYYTLDAQFLASTQVIVYAGAIMVLFLFVIMLLNASQPESSEDPIPWVRPVAIAGGLALASALTVASFQFTPPQPLEAATRNLNGGTPGAVGEVLFTQFLLQFESVSILLLVAIVGAVALVSRAPKTSQQSVAVSDHESGTSLAKGSVN
jgi:NADH-quinone oxidoreductase subunit J